MRNNTENALQAEPPLCVDLDGTLIAGDSSWELLLALAKSRPLDLLKIPFWLASGRARLKREMSSRASIDPALLPYRADLLDFLREEKRKSRRLVLATGTHRSIADAVADHLQIFDEVAATEGDINLTGPRKLAELNRRFGPGNFDYVGDSPTDLCLWQNVRKAYLVAPNKRLARRAAQVCKPARVFGVKPSPLAALVVLRPGYWLTNLLVFVPLIFAHELSDRGRVIASFIAFGAFSLAASAMYILNDLLDLEADRRDPRKRSRPFASGALRISLGIAMIGALLIAAFVTAAMLPAKLAAWLAVYVLLRIFYSSGLKRRFLAGVIILASLYTIRIVAGAAAIDAEPLTWLLATAMLVFLGLAVPRAIRDRSRRR